MAIKKLIYRVFDTLVFYRTDGLNIGHSNADTLFNVGLHIVGGIYAEKLANNAKFLDYVAHNEVEIIAKGDELPTAVEFAKALLGREVSPAEKPYLALHHENETKYLSRGNNLAWQKITVYLGLFELAMGRDGGARFYYNSYCTPLIGSFKEFTVAQIQALIDSEENGNG